MFCITSTLLLLSLLCLGVFCRKRATELIWPILKCVRSFKYKGNGGLLVSLQILCTVGMPTWGKRVCPLGLEFCWSDGRVPMPWVSTALFSWCQMTLGYLVSLTSAATGLLGRFGGGFTRLRTAEGFCVPVLDGFAEIRENAGEPDTLVNYVHTK